MIGVYPKVHRLARSVFFVRDLMPVGFAPFSHQTDCHPSHRGDVDVSGICEHVFVMTTVFEVRLTSARDLRGLQLELGMMAAVFDPDAVHLRDVPGLFAEIDAVERWAVTIKTLVARRMEDAATWKRAGYRSAAEQMAAVSGTSVSAARGTLETSKQIEALPATA
jgi:hypothetical protein